MARVGIAQAAHHAAPAPPAAVRTDRARSDEGPALDTKLKEGDLMAHDHDHGGCCGDGHGHDTHRVQAGPGDELVICAVKGSTTLRSQAELAGLVRDYDGVRYYFCCAHCADAFDADPSTYATVA